MKRVLITGATGMIGSLVLQECLNSPEISEVISISRKKANLLHPKLKEISHTNFSDYSTIASYFENIDIAYFCIGVYTGTVSRDEFRTITVDYTKAFADQLIAKSPQATFCFLSGQGADHTEKSRMMFAKDKGIAENYLLNCKFKNLHIFRPAYIYPVTPRTEPNFGYRVFRALYPVLKNVFPNNVVTSEHLAKAIFRKGLNGEGQNTYENKEIRLIK